MNRFISFLSDPEHHYESGLIGVEAEGPGGRRVCRAGFSGLCTGVRGQLSLETAQCGGVQLLPGLPCSANRRA